MARVIMTSAAEVDLCDVWLDIADNSPAIAGQCLDLLAAKFNLLSKFPELGESHPVPGARVRCLPVASYVIVCRPLEDGIEWIRILHGACDFESLF